MYTYDMVYKQWSEVDRDVRQLLSKTQYAKYVLSNVLPSSTASGLVSHLGMQKAKITRPFDASRHNGLSARMDGVRASLDAFVRDIDEKNAYRANEYSIAVLRRKMGETQRILDQWYCDAQ